MPFELNQNRKAFLEMLGYSEGTSLIPNSDNGYLVIVGSTPNKPILMKGYANHPRKKQWLTKWKIYSTAAGRYQILARYFDAYRKQLCLPDFSPASQDQIALQLIKECDALEDIDQGHFDVAVKKCKSRWASLPGAGYGQRENELASLQEAYTNAGGQLSS